MSKIWFFCWFTKKYYYERCKDAGTGTTDGWCWVYACICVSVSPHLSSLGCSCHLFFGARNWSRMLYDFEFLKWQWIIINDVLTAFLCWARRIFPISIFSDNIAVKTSWIALKSVRKWSWVDAIYKIIILCLCTASGK